MEDLTDHRIKACEEENEALRKCIDTNEALLTEHSDAIARLNRWALEGNGTSAENRLKHIEDMIMALEKTNIGERLNAMEADMDILQRVTDATIKQSLVTAMDERDGTAIARLKAWGPIVAAGFAAVAVVVQALVK
jgi:hypothetical protein